MTVLVAYATHSGATTTLAETIVATLTEAGTPAELVDVTIEPDPSAYDAVVLGSGIRIESIEKTAVQWARDHRAALLERPDRKSTRLNSSHVAISYAVFCLKKKRHHRAR